MRDRIQWQCSTTTRLTWPLNRIPCHRPSSREECRCQATMDPTQECLSRIRLPIRQIRRTRCHSLASCRCHSLTPCRCPRTRRWWTLRRTTMWWAARRTRSKRHTILIFRPKELIRWESSGINFKTKLVLVSRQKTNVYECASRIAYWECDKTFDCFVQELRCEESLKCDMTEMFWGRLA